MIVSVSMYACASLRDASAFVLMARIPDTDRRSAVGEMLSSASAAALAICTVAGAKNLPARAVAPFAPVDALLPAARVKVAIDRAVAIASNLASSSSESEENVDDARKRSMLRDLEGLLLAPQNFNRGTAPIDVPRRPARAYLDAYADYRNRATVLERPGAMLVQNGEIDAWKRLKRQERVREDADEVRAALNYYTSNLNFDPDRLVLTGTREEKSRLIREDAVPDVRGVIASDMGLRYLLRNDVLTACDDARAELRYQARQRTVNGEDLLELLLSAQKALGKWFDLIEEKDTLTAIDIVSREI